MWRLPLQILFISSAMCYGVYVVACAVIDLFTSRKK